MIDDEKLLADLSGSISQAVVHRDIILDIYDGGILERKPLIYNDTKECI